MADNDLVHDGETEARAILFGADERIEDTVEFVIRDADTFIHDLHGDLGALRHRRADRNRTAFGHGLLSVQEQVEHDLLEKVGVERHRRQIRGELETIVDRRGHILVLQKGRGAVHDIVDLTTLQFRCGRPGKVEEIAHDPRQAVDLFQDEIG